MKRATLPAALAKGIEEISGATRDLVAAAKELDPEALTRALETRAAAIQTLEPAVADYRRRAGSAGDEALNAARTELQLKADEAREGLDTLMKDIRLAAEKMKKESSALRSYTATDSPGSLLKRSG